MTPTNALYSFEVTSLLNRNIEQKQVGTYKIGSMGWQASLEIFSHKEETFKVLVINETKLESCGKTNARFCAQMTCFKLKLNLENTAKVSSISSKRYKLN